MKKIQLLFLMLLLGIGMQVAKAQMYYPLLEDGKTWNVLEGISGSYGFMEYQTRTLLCLGDSIVNDLKYKKMYHSLEKEPTSWSFHCQINHKYGCYHSYTFPNSIDENIHFSISIYPNPATTTIHIDNPENISIKQMALYNLQG